MVKFPSKPILKLRGTDNLYYIEVDSDTSPTTLTSASDFTGFEIEYTCPECLSRNESKFTSFPDKVCLLCSSCNKSHLLYDVSDEELVLITVKLEKLVGGLRGLCGKSQIRQIVDDGDLSVFDCVLFRATSLLIDGVRLLSIGIGFLVAQLSLYIPSARIFLLFIALFLILCGVFNPNFLSRLRDTGDQWLISWFKGKSQYEFSSTLLTENYTNGLLRWKLSD